MGDQRLQAYASECGKLRKSPKNAQIWLRKRMFTNFPKAKIEPPQALRFVRGLARQSSPFVLTRASGRRGRQAQVLGWAGRADGGV